MPAPPVMFSSRPVGLTARKSIPRIASAPIGYCSSRIAMVAIPSKSPMPESAGAACGEFLRSSQTEGRDEGTINRMTRLASVEIRQPDCLRKQASQRGVAVQPHKKASAERRKMTAFQGIFRSEGTRDGRGQRLNGDPALRRHCTDARQVPTSTLQK